MTYAEACKVFDVNPGASREEIDAVWKRKVKKYHPDRYLDEGAKELAEELFKPLNEAHEVLLKSSPGASAAREKRDARNAAAREMYRKKREAERRRQEEEAWRKAQEDAAARAEKRRQEEEAREEKRRQEEEAREEKRRQEEEARALKKRINFALASAAALFTLVFLFRPSYSAPNWNPPPKAAEAGTSTYQAKPASVPSTAQKPALTVEQHRELVTKLRSERMSDSALDALMNRLGINKVTRDFVQQAASRSDWQASLNELAGFKRDYRLALTNTNTVPAAVKPATVKPTPVKPPPPTASTHNSAGQIIPAAMRGTWAGNVTYRTHSTFKNYAFYPARAFLDANGWNMTSLRAYEELPQNIIDTVRKLGDYLHDNYTYGEKKNYNGLGQDNDAVFDCDDFAALMYRLGRQAGLEMYIIDMPGHWANAVRYGSTLYTIEPQGYEVRYRDNVSFGARNVKQYALHTENIVVEK